MSTTLIILFAVKAFVVVMFAMNVAVLLTWADRRERTLIQDCIGPNRAVAWLPTRLAQLLAIGPALLVAGGVIALFLLTDASGGARTSRAVLFSHLAIFITWVTSLVIAGRVRQRGIQYNAPLVGSFDRFIAALGDPRRIFYAGLALHLLTVFVGATLRGTAEGRQLRDIAYGAGPAVFAVVVLFGAVYTALSINGEDRVGLRLAGLLHPAADGLKTMFKEDFVPPQADRFLHSIAPIISFFPALVVMAVVPFGDTLCFRTGDKGQLLLSKLVSSAPAEGMCTDGALKLQALDVNVGVLYFFALAGTGIVGAALAGWASNNKYSLLGGLRAASQMVSYEVTLGLTIIGAVMVYGTLRLDEMVRWQAENTWGIFVQPLAFVLFFAAAVAESKRIPFDLPEGESEIVAGYFTEYSGMKFAMFFFSEYVAVVSSSALLVTLFLGGWHLPFLDRSGLHLAVGDSVLIHQQLSHGLVVLLGVLGFILKTVGICWLQLTIRWTLPRFRYDQLMRLGWRKLLPASLVNILATGLVILALQSPSPSLLAGLGLAADLTMLLVAVAGAVGVVSLVAFLLAPAQKRRRVISTSAEFAAQQGGTRTAKMGA